jgi:hypothetical protein
MAAEPQPRSGALAGTAAGTAGAAVENTYAAAAAKSDAPGISPAIGAALGLSPSRSKPNDPAAWGYAARSPTAGKIWRTTPPSGSRYVRRRAPFQRANCPAVVSGPLNLFLSVQTKPCLGHCTTRGISLRRQATIFRLCGATFFRGQLAPREETGCAPRRRIHGVGGRSGHLEMAIPHWRQSHRGQD